MDIQGFTLVDSAKFDRALNGTLRGNNTVIGGVGAGAYFENGAWLRNGTELNEEEVAKLEFDLLAEYDKLGGLIRKGGDKVVTGSFYNFKAKKPHDAPQVKFIFRVNGKAIEVPDGEALPGIVRAKRILDGVEEDVEPETIDSATGEETTEDEGRVQSKKTKKGKK